MSATSLMIPYWLGIALRIYFSSSSASTGLASPDAFNPAQRVEIATPLNAYHRLTEGVALFNQGLDPYSGVLCHEPPLFLKLGQWVQGRRAWAKKIPAFFIMFDLLTAALVGLLARLVVQRLLQRQNEESDSYHKDAAELLLEQTALDSVDFTAQLSYLFNPFLILSSAGQTTTVFDNFFLALFLVAMLKKNRIGACLFLALAVYKSFYPIMLLVPLMVMFMEGSKKSWRQELTTNVLPTLVIFCGFLVGLLWMSYMIMGRNPSFLWATYGFILSVPELTPNMGLFWYFFTEMFEHFRVFFVCTFQINAFIYVIPLAIKLRHDPFLLAFTLIGLTAIFKSYPSYGDVGFYLALLPILSHLFPYTKQLFVVAVMLTVTTVLGPILYHLWIYNGSANANYFFAINLVFGTAQIFLLTDLLFAYLKREFYLINGYKILNQVNESTQKPHARIVLT
ncbi:phosphatidylinositol glycan anchor biosynthesis class U protein-like [Tigriopus californicus]|uniref:phosphatidylinositol glycan anchor biosynthesis class U protein-like n=1 Tax=Tigriopus californicus TaxID=6832 RepID=UPI0027D9EA03|nr:phosphatidylinositol glycan anchor biosynthesis class U protein-like [Tigriopus californicus]